MAKPSEYIQEESHDQEAARVRRSVLLIVGVTLVVTCVMSTYVELKPRSARLAMSNLQMAVMLPFVFWLLSNALLKRYAPRQSLTSAEMRLMLAVLWVGGSFAGFNWATMWTGMMASPTYLASPENRWEELFFGAMPWWVYPSTSPRVIESFYLGLERGEILPWGAWAAPIFWATSAALAILAIGIGVTAIFQKQWVQHERLAYPVAQVSLDLTEGFDRRIGWPPFMRTRAFWIGFAIAAIPILWNIIGYWVIGFPRIGIFERYGAQRRIFLSRYLPPHALSYRLLPTLLGFTFLCNLDILFGIWSAYVVGLVFRYGMNRTGFSVGLQGQAIEGDGIVNLFSDGAIVGLVIWAIWMARGHLTRVYRQVVNPVEGERSETVILPPRVASAVLAAGLIYLFFYVHGMGLQYHTALFWLVLFCFGLFATMKFLAASGFVYIYPFWGRSAENATLNLVGTRAMSESDMVGIKVVNFRTLGGWRVPHTLPNIERILGTDRNMGKLVSGSLVVGLLTSALYTIWMCYQEGGATLDPWNMRNAPNAEYNLVATLLANTSRSVVDPGKLSVWLLGGTMAILFGVLQARVSWWPAHPLGLMLIPRYQMQIYMLNVFLVWLSKTLILKFGGILLYRKFRPVALGLIVGYVFGLGCSIGVDLIWFPEQGHHIHTW